MTSRICVGGTGALVSVGAPQSGGGDVPWWPEAVGVATR